MSMPQGPLISDWPCPVVSQTNASAARVMLSLALTVHEVKGLASKPSCPQLLGPMFLIRAQDTNQARLQQTGSSDGRWRSTSLEAAFCLLRRAWSLEYKVKCDRPTSQAVPADKKSRNLPSREYVRLRGFVAFRYAAGVIREYVSLEQCLVASDRQRIPNLPQ